MLRAVPVFAPVGPVARAMPHRFGSTPPVTAQPPFQRHPKQIDDDIYQVILATPKMALHEHFSGSIDLSLVMMHDIEHGIPNLEWEQAREMVRMARSTRYNKTYNRLDLQDDESQTLPGPHGLARYRDAYEKIRHFAKQFPYAYQGAYLYTLKSAFDNVRYFELRTTPFPEKGTAEDFIKTLVKGADHARDEAAKWHLPIDYGILLVADRHGDTTVNPTTGRMAKVDKAMKTAETAIELRQKGYPVVGFDLAGDEKIGPVTDFAPVFQRIQGYNKTAPPSQRLGITLHAGETHTSGPLEGWQSVAESVRLAWSPETPVRIGHGVQVINSSPLLRQAFEASRRDPHWQRYYPPERVIESSPLLQEILQKGVALEMCPKSNVQTEAIGWYDEHPALFLSQLGVKVSISADNQTISATRPTNEYVKLWKYLGVDHAARKKMVLDAMDTAFIFDPAKKQQILGDIREGFDKLERNPALVVGRYKERHQGQAPSPLKRLLLTLEAQVKTMWHELSDFARALFREVETRLQQGTATPQSAARLPARLHTPKTVLLSKTDTSPPKPVGRSRF